MKKQNILELLCGEYLEQLKNEQTNFDLCIDNFDKCINKYIVPFIKENSRLFELDFDFSLTSDDIIDQDKSSLLLELVCQDFKKLVSIKPDYFKKCQQENDFKYACDKICMCVMVGNIDIYKKLLNKL